MAGKDPARPSGAHQLRAGGIPPAAVLSTERDFSPTPLTFTTGSEQSPDPTPAAAPRVRRGQAQGEEPEGTRGAVPASKVTLPATGPRDLPPRRLTSPESDEAAAGA